MVTRNGATTNLSFSDYYILWFALFHHPQAHVAFHHIEKLNFEIA
jgi:hypothetical protein